MIHCCNWNGSYVFWVKTKTANEMGANRLAGIFFQASQDQSSGNSPKLGQPRFDLPETRSTRISVFFSWASGLVRWLRVSNTMTKSVIMPRDFDRKTVKRGSQFLIVFERTVRNEATTTSTRTCARKTMSGTSSVRGVLRNEGGNPLRPSSRFMHAHTENKVQGQRGGGRKKAFIACMQSVYIVTKSAYAASTIKAQCLKKCNL